MFNDDAMVLNYFSVVLRKNRKRERERAKENHLQSKTSLQNNVVMSFDNEMNEENTLSTIVVIKLEGK